VASVSELYLVDSSVLLRAIIEGSPAARKWFEGMDAGSMVASKLLEVECRRVLLNRAILAGGPDVPVDPSPFLDRIALVDVSDSVLRQAGRVRAVVKSADAIHLATALELAPDPVTVATHDVQMSSAALALGLAVFDPVTDDPRARGA